MAEILVPSVDEWSRVLKIAGGKIGSAKVPASLIDKLSSLRTSSRAYVSVILGFTIFLFICTIILAAISMFPIYGWGSSSTGAFALPVLPIGMVIGVSVFGFNCYNFFVRTQYTYLRYGVYTISLITTLLYAALQLVVGVQFCNDDAVKDAKPAINILCQTDLPYLYLYAAFGFGTVVPIVVIWVMDGLIQRKASLYNRACVRWMVYDVVDTLGLDSGSAAMNVTSKDIPDPDTLPERYLALFKRLGKENEAIRRDERYERLYFWLADVKELVKDKTE